VGKGGERAKRTSSFSPGEACGDTLSKKGGMIAYELENEEKKPKGRGSWGSESQGGGERHPERKKEKEVDAG